ncbi:polyamine aminopropyltransferase [Enhydrobacter sp.]|uniref:polyamine aminopropyltransferase n=1 Tax=Enhydrobacter sp. TaxID=1894999 RepID=UPI00260B3FC5|nr:polyamine aminopropyltransferase [Enhydrobacter sp.]WIM09919.1 MAG: Spermidine synthase [Enhydrobacter sp.]
MNSFLETLAEHHAQVLTVDAVLHSGRTAYQDVLIFENRLFGKVLVLDGVIQLTERDNHIYHEMIAHVPMMAHGSARRVLIIGGGDGGTLREVLRHPVAEVVLVEIDEGVIALSQRFLPEVSGGAFSDRRATVIVGDGSLYVADAMSPFDIIIVDSTDPAGPGERLFSEAFYRGCLELLRPGGILALQSGTPFYRPDQLDDIRGRLAASFAAIRPFMAPVPTYAGGMLALVVASASHRALQPSTRTLRARFRRLQGQTRYYVPDVHQAAFAMAPAFVRGARPFPSNQPPTRVATSRPNNDSAPAAVAAQAQRGERVKAKTEA